MTGEIKRIKRIELDKKKYHNIAKLGVEKIELLNTEKYKQPFVSCRCYMFAVYFERRYSSEAITLKTEEYCQETDFRRVNGWSMLGKVHEDYFYWIEEFVAFKGLDMVFGNFLDKVSCDSLDALEDFLKNFEVERWDFYDI